jgi:hypothetical protein
MEVLPVGAPRHWRSWPSSAAYGTAAFPLTLLGGGKREVFVNRTEGGLKQGKALVRAIEAADTIEATGPIERGMVAPLLQTYRRRLRAVVASAPTWVSEEILSASREIDDQRPAVWLSDN